MFEIKGKRNVAICYAKVFEDEAIKQIKQMLDYEFVQNSKIRIMPDVHAGKGCTIGTTMTIKDKVVPNLVGVDIGCGMYTVNLGKSEIDLEKLDIITHIIPSGMDVWNEKQGNFDLQNLCCYDRLKNIKRLEQSLGTLGGGNHFIEVDQTKDGTKYLIIHTGSRNLGKQVANIYQHLATELHKDKDYSKQKDKIIQTYKEQGRTKDIQEALKELSSREKETEIPEELCYLYGSLVRDYLNDVEICQNFAKQNREKIAELILEYLGINTNDGFHTIHNYIDVEEMILRKGAIAAHKGERVLIPINMRDGSVLAIGKGNPEWNYSAPHGAGRIMSRKKAKNELDLEEYKKTMQGIYTTSISKETLDEAPMAYKKIDDIIDVIEETVDIIEIMKPIYNFKAN